VSLDSTFFILGLAYPSVHLEDIIYKAFSVCKCFCYDCGKNCP